MYFLIVHGIGKIHFLIPVLGELINWLIIDDTGKLRLQSHSLQDQNDPFLVHNTSKM